MYNSIEFLNNNYIIDFIDIQYQINIIHPLIELKRYELIQSIKQKIRIIFDKENIHIDVNNILPRFIMLQFKNKNYYIDPILPYQANDYSQLKKDLYYLSNKKLSKEKIENIIKLLNLTKLFNDAIEILRSYIHDNSNLFTKNYVININKTNDFVFIQYDFDKEIESNYYKKLSLNHFKLHIKLYDKLINNYIHGNKNDDVFKKLLLCLLLRYNSLESYNQQLAILPEFKHYLNEKYGVNFELFASSINCEYNHYCSLFYDIEKNFQSKGSFNLIKMKKGFFVSNPPFDEEIMKNMSLQFIHFLNNKQNEELSILITIPNWINNNYDDYEAYSLLKKSGFITYEKIIKKQDAIFFDYYKNKYLTPCSILLIIIQNNKGRNIHLIDNEFKIKMNDFFSNKYLNILNQQIGKGKNNRQFNKNKNHLILKLKHQKKIKFKSNIIIKEAPPEYSSKNAKIFYLKKAKMYYQEIFSGTKKITNLTKLKNNNTTKIKLKPHLIKFYTYDILKYIIKDRNIKKFSIIDLTYNCENYHFIQKRQKMYYDTLINYILEEKMFISEDFTFLYNPLYHLNKKNSNKTFDFIINLNYQNMFKDIENNQDFVIISGTLKYYETKEIYYYLEQFQYVYMFIQIYYLIHILKINGSFMMFCWSMSTEFNKNILILLQKMFTEIILYKRIDLEGNNFYIVGKGFKGLNKSDSLEMNNIYNNLKEYIALSGYGNKLNIKDPKLRKEKFTFKSIRFEDYNKFLYKIVNIELDSKIKKNIYSQINNFHKKIFDIS